MKRSFKSFEIRPAVCAAGNDYIIMVPVSAPVLMSVYVNGTQYTNDRNGVKVSSCHVQKFTVPMKALNEAREYTVTYEIIYRVAYCSLKEAPVSKTFRFYPLEKTDGINVYHLSDVHGRKKQAIQCAGYFADDLDLLILNGDISSSTQTVKESLLPIQIAYAVTKGEKPCIITRGNHDLRGKYAESIEEFYPLANGRFYYTVQLGPLWFLVLDCGEDKNDDHREYAGTVAFHQYRQKETEFIRSVVNSGEAEGGAYKLIVSHIPFMHTDYNPIKKVHEFDIEIETYSEWVSLINNGVRPCAGLFGHVHQTGVFTGESRYNQKGFAAPMIFGGKPVDSAVEGCAITFSQKQALVVFNNSSNTHTQSCMIDL